MNQAHKSNSTPDNSARKLLGLCFSFHHLNTGAVGSRRFRNLVKLLQPFGIELDVICGRTDNTEEEPGVVTAGNFAPFQTIMQILSKIKKRIATSETISEERPGLGTANTNTFSDEQATADTSLTSLLFSFENLPDSDAGWVLPAILAGMRVKQKYDFIISTAPPWSSHIAAIVVGKRLGLPVILDDRDPWAGSTGRLLYMTHPWMRNLDRSLASHCYRRASAIVCVTEPACEMHRERPYGTQTPISCLPNGFDPKLADRATQPVRQDRINISYVGSYYHGRSPLIVLKSALALPVGLSRDFHFHFVGNISSDEAERINTLEKPFEVTLYGPQSHEFCLERISESDVCLLMAIGQPSQIPAKLYEYIGLQRPALTVSKRNDATMQQIQERKWGWATHDSSSITSALNEIHQRWTTGNLIKIDSKVTHSFSFDTIAGDYAGLIRRLTTLESFPADPAGERL